MCEGACAFNGWGTNDHDSTRRGRSGRHWRPFPRGCTLSEPRCRPRGIDRCYRGRGREAPQIGGRFGHAPREPPRLVATEQMEPSGLNLTDPLLTAAVANHFATNHTF